MTERTPPITMGAHNSLQRTFASDSQVFRGSGSTTLFPPMGSFRAPSTLSTVTDPASEAPSNAPSAAVVAANPPELRAFDAWTGRPAGEIKLEESLVMPPAFGKSGDSTLMSAFTGTLNGQWKLVLAGPPVSAPAAPRE